MVKASRYEREFISWASQYGLVARIAASGTLNTIVGDLILIPHKKYHDVLPRPLIIEIKATHSDVYYPSKHFRQISLLQALSKYFNYDPYLAVKFIGRGWVIVPLSDGVPQRVSADDAEPIPTTRKTISIWLREENDPLADNLPPTTTPTTTTPTTTTTSPADASSTADDVAQTTEQGGDAP